MLDLQPQETLKLFDYQREGAKWLLTRKFALLADEMGLGKSAQAITAARTLKFRNILILCPAIARFNWQKEIGKFWKDALPFTQVVLSSKDKITKPIVICSYDLNTTEEFRAKLLPNLDLIILDECHYLKQPKSRRTRATLGKSYGVCHTNPNARVWAMSGTPAPNHAAELWTFLFSFGIMPLSYEEFVTRYCTYYHIHNQRVVTGNIPKMVPELKKFLNLFMLRRTKAQVSLELPPLFISNTIVEGSDFDPTQMVVFVDQTRTPEKTKKLYKQLKLERDELAKNLALFPTFEEKYECLQGIAKSVMTLRRYTALLKMGAIADLVSDELNRGEYKKVVIFAFHRDMIFHLREKLKDHGALTIFGGTEPARRERNLENFQNNPKYKVLVVNIHAAGTAISLTAANQVIMAEPAWTPADNAQAIARCHRIGQKEPVNVRFIELNDSVDQHVMGILRRKTKQFLDLFDGHPQDSSDIEKFKQLNGERDIFS